MLSDRAGQMVIFYTLVRQGSFTAAARQLDVSTSHISKQIVKLEASLDVKLVQRTTRTITTTQAGEQFYRCCAQVMEAIADGEAIIANQRDEVCGTLKLGMAQSFGSLHVIPQIEKLRDLYPELQIELSLFDGKVDMLEAGLDLWLTNIESLPEGYVAQRLTDTRFVLAASPDYLTRFGTPYHPHELADHNCVIYHSRERDYSTWSFEKEGEEIRVNVSGNYQVDQAEAVRNAAISGWGVAYLATYLLKDEFRNGELIQLLPDWLPNQEMRFYAVYPSRKHMPRKLSVVIDFLRQNLGEKPYWEKALSRCVRLGTS